MKSPRAIVAGGGPVGLALACALPGFEVHVIESAPRVTPRDGEFELRIFAISPGARAFLREIGAWDRMDARRIEPVRRMEIFGDEGARLAFSARPGASLAWIVEASRLARALDEQAASLANVNIVRDVATRFAAEASGAWAELESGARLEGELLVGADGPGSRVRAQLGLASAEEPYGEAAVVANFATALEHGSVARQWFRPDGVLAWLPLPGKRVSIVWSAPSSVADALASLEPAQLEKRVREAGESILGEMTLVSGVGRFDLRSIRVDEPVGPGVALVGDAAHAIHPLAGQGVNLGFQDARVLAEVLAGRGALERPGDLRLLRRYARSRREDVTAMHFVTDGLDKLFAAGNPGIRVLRNVGLRLVQSQPWITDALADRAMR
ncbi:MAG TPA: FAD-dependent monooxygenase [Usitatibacter sp.]|nr:FAD-dependent monooxygenase [Usitatibacter sp.]